MPTSSRLKKHKFTKVINTMKNKEKKVKATEEEAKKEVQPEEEGVELTEEELAKVSGGTGQRCGDTREEYSMNPEDNNRSIYGALY